MIKRFFSLLWILHSVQDGDSQYFICPYENGLYYATSPDCLVYYRCQNRMLWSGVCFPWQRFDMHLMSCRYVENVDCSPEYAGIWKPIYGESNVINQVVQESNQDMADEEIQGAAEEETEMLGNEAEEDIQEEANEETINNEANQEEIQEATEEIMIPNEAEGEEIQEETEEEIAGNESEEVGNLETSQAEEDAIENEELQGEEVQTEDEDVLNEENQDAILQEKNSDDKDEFSKDEIEGDKEDIIQENRLNSKLEENKIITDEEGKGGIDDGNGNGPSVKIDNKEIQNDEVEQAEMPTDDEQREQENKQKDPKLAKIEARLDDEKHKRAAHDIASDGKFLPKLFKNIPIARESVIPDLMGPIVTSIFIEESTTETKGVPDQVDKETNCQLSTGDADIEPLVESTSVETKQEDSSGKFWYWCGSGRFVMTQTPQDPSTICQQLEDPQFIDQEGPATGTQDWGGHTFLGSDTSVSKRHTS